MLIIYQARRACWQIFSPNFNCHPSCFKAFERIDLSAILLDVDSRQRSKRNENCSLSPSEASNTSLACYWHARFICSRSFSAIPWNSAHLHLPNWTVVFLLNWKFTPVWKRLNLSYCKLRLLDGWDRYSNFWCIVLHKWCVFIDKNIWNLCNCIIKIS